MLTLITGPEQLTDLAPIVVTEGEEKGWEGIVITDRAWLSQHPGVRGEGWTGKEDDMVYLAESGVALEEAAIYRVQKADVIGGTEYQLRSTSPEETDIDLNDDDDESPGNVEEEDDEADHVGRSSKAKGKAKQKPSAQAEAHMIRCSYAFPVLVAAPTDHYRAAGKPGPTYGSIPPYTKSPNATDYTGKFCSDYPGSRSGAIPSEHPGIPGEHLAYQGFFNLGDTVDEQRLMPFVLKLGHVQDRQLVDKCAFDVNCKKMPQGRLKTIETPILNARVGVNGTAELTRAMQTKKNVHSLELRAWQRQRDQHVLKIQALSGVILEKTLCKNKTTSYYKRGPPFNSKLQCYRITGQPTLWSLEHEGFDKLGWCTGMRAAGFDVRRADLRKAVPKFVREVLKSEVPDGTVGLDEGFVCSEMAAAYWHQLVITHDLNKNPRLLQAFCSGGPSALRAALRS